MVLSLVDLSSVQCTQFVDAFVANGMLDRENGKLFLHDSPDTSTLDELIEQVLSRL